VHDAGVRTVAIPFVYCHYWLARDYHDGAGTPRDLVKAYAHYTVAKQLGRQEAGPELQRLDGSLQHLNLKVVGSNPTPVVD
jgi:TPR repeat protein